MKDLNKFIYERLKITKNSKPYKYQNTMMHIVNDIDKLINETYIDIDVLIFDILDGISDKGNDEVVTREIESWINSLKN